MFKIHSTLHCNQNRIKQSFLGEPIKSSSYIRDFYCNLLKIPLRSQALPLTILCRNIYPIKPFFLHNVVMCGMYHLISNHYTITKLSSIVTGERLWQLSQRQWNQIILDQWSIFLKESTPQVASGFIKLNTNLMEVLIDTKYVQWQRGIPNRKDWTPLKHSHQQPCLLQLNLSQQLPPSINGKSLNQT